MVYNAMEAIPAARSCGQPVQDTECSPMMQPAGPVQARIESVVLGVQLAHVVVRISENRLVGAFIPRRYAEELNLGTRTTVTTRVTETEVLFEKG